MRVSHPRALDDDTGPAPSRVDVRGTTVPVEDDGTFEIDDEPWLQQFADAYDVTVDELHVEDVSEDGLLGSFDPTDHTVDEVQDHVESIDGSDIVEELEAIRGAESEGKNRTTALEAIDDRLEAEEAD